MTPPLYSISLDISDLGECPFWHGEGYGYLGWHTLDTHGNDIEELIQNAHLFTLDQDGGSGPACLLTDIADVTRERLIHRIYREIDSLREKRELA